MILSCLYIIMKLLLILVCVGTVWGNIVISVEEIDSTVGQSTTMTINIRTSTPINTLLIKLNNEFTINTNPSCKVNSTTTTCTVTSTLSNINVQMDEFAFQADTSYSISLTVTNPYYEDNFEVECEADGVQFTTPGIIIINAKNITCSMSSLSDVVGLAAETTFLLGFSSLPEGSQGNLFLTVPEQSVFPDLFNANPVCTIDDDAYPCTISLVFGEQIIKIDNVPVGNITRQLNIKTINNSPFNNTFETIKIDVQDTNGRNVQKCTIVQPQPSTLQPSNSLEFEGWESLVGAQSTVDIFLAPYFTAFDDVIVLLVYPQELTILPKAPITYTTESRYNLTFLYADNVGKSLNVLQLSCDVINPSSAIPLSLETYILYNSTHFREEKVLPPSQLTLTTETVTVSAVADVPNTLTSTSLNVTFQSPISIGEDVELVVVIELGSVLCDDIVIGSNVTGITVAACTTSQLTLTAPSNTLSPTDYYIHFPYQTYTSTRSNSIKLSFTNTEGYEIMEGSSTISISQATSVFTIINLNPTFTETTDITITQQNTTSLNSVQRVATITLPTYMELSGSTDVESVSSDCVIISQHVDYGNGEVVVTVRGRIEIQLKQVVNPSHYQGQRVWQLELLDRMSNPSSTSTTTHTPQYSPVNVPISVSLSQTTIQQNNNITFSIQPQLQYDLSDPPTIIFQLTSTISSMDAAVCPGCTLLTSTRLSMPYYAVLMQATVEIVNGDNPNDNGAAVAISLNGFIYQSNTLNYTLTPILYEYEVNFEGVMGQVGTLTINLTTTLNREVTLSYTGTNSIFSSDEQCTVCNSTYLTITGIVGYFTSAVVQVEGSANGILHASAAVHVVYSCSAISGCQICDTTDGQLLCSKCFSEELTPSYLLYSGKCYSNCPASSYISGVICEPCEDLCYLCNADECLQCQSPYSLYQSTCVEQCPPSYIKNATHCLPRPIICPQDCIECPADNECIRCDGTLLVLDNLCYSECPEGYVVSDNGYECEEFIPPEETDYFPFAFFIASVIVFFILAIIKRFQKRSLVLGNFIAVVSLLEIGTIIMMITYTFVSIVDEPDYWTSDNILLTQALLYVFLMSKIALNVIFLIYFLRNIATDENFTNWVNKADNNRCLYVVLLVLSSIFSFQIMRMIYSRLLGLELFFGRFNTALIFKPINYFTIAYLVPSICLLVMSANNIILQDGYRTSIFYSSIQMILMEVVLLIACAVEAKRSDSEYFDYQIYKIENQNEDVATGSKINITYQQQNGGSMHQVLAPELKRGRIIEEEEAEEYASEWRRRTYHPSIQHESQNRNDWQNQDGLDEHYDSSQMLESKIKNQQEGEKRKSLFREKILTEWQKLKANMPSPSRAAFRRTSDMNRISVSPSHPSRKKQPSKPLMKTSSLEKIEIRSPILDYKKRKQLKKYFYQIKQKDGQEEDSFEQKSKQLRDLDDHINSDANTRIEQALMNKDQEGQEGYEVIGRKENDQRGDMSEIKKKPSQESFNPSLLEDFSNNFRVNRYADFEKEQEEEIEEQNYNDQIKQELSSMKNLAGRNKANRSKSKKKYVNRYTQAIYLQRLVSSEMHKKGFSHQRKLDDF